jgi:hypothetical protein
VATTSCAADRFGESEDDDSCSAAIKGDSEDDDNSSDMSSYSLETI